MYRLYITSDNGPLIWCLVRATKKSLAPVSRLFVPKACSVESSGEAESDRSICSFAAALRPLPYPGLAAPKIFCRIFLKKGLFGCERSVRNTFRTPRKGPKCCRSHHRPEDIRDSCQICLFIDPYGVEESNQNYEIVRDRTRNPKFFTGRSVRNGRPQTLHHREPNSNTMFLHATNPAGSRTSRTIAVICARNSQPQSNAERSA